MVLDIRARKKVARIVDPVARAIDKIGVTPTMVTLLGLAIVITGAALIAAGYLPVGCIVMGVGALLDVVDGVLARVTDQETKRGALLDSFTDRIGEVAVWGGLAFYLSEEGESTLVLLALVGISGSLLIPYLRSKAEGEGVDGKGGLMGRAERLILLGVVVGLDGFGLPTIEIGLIALTSLIWLTVLQRFIRTWAQLKV